MKLARLALVLLTALAGAVHAAQAPLSPESLSPDAGFVYRGAVGWIEELADREQAGFLEGGIAELDEMLEGEDSFFVGELHWLLAGRLALLQADTSRVAEHYRLAREAYTEAGFDLRAAFASQNYSAMLQELFRLPEALREMERLQAYYVEDGKPKDVAEGRVNIANTLHMMGREGEAIEQVGPAIEYARAERDWQVLQKCLQLRGAALRQSGRYMEALADYEEVLEFAERQGLAEALGLGLQAIGNVYSELSRHEQALGFNRRARAAFERTGNEVLVAKVDSALGATLSGLGRTDEALEHFGRALEVLRPDFEAVSWRTTRFGLAALLVDLGDLEGGAEINAELMRWARENGDLDLEADTLQNQAHIAVLRGDLDAALAGLDQVAAIRELFGDRLAGLQVAEGRANLLRERGDLEQALVAFEQTASLLNEFQREQLLGLGDASSHALRATFRATLGGALAAVEAQGEEQRDLELAYEILQTFHGAALQALLAERSSALGEIPDGLRAEYDAASTELDQAEALRAAWLQERARSANQDRGEDRSEMLAAARGAIAPLEERVQAAGERLDRVLERARAANASRAPVSYPRPASLADVRSLLDERTCLIEYAWTEQGVFAFVLSAESTAFERIGDSQEVARWVRAALAAVRDPDPAQALPELRRAGDRLVAPLLGEGGFERVLVAPDGELCALPLGVLRWGGGAGSDGGERFLIADFDLAYVHSGTVLRASRLAPRDERPVGRRFVAFGDPRWTHTGSDLVASERSDAGRLPGAAREAVDVALLAEADPQQRERLQQAREQLAEPDATFASALVGPSTFVALGDAATEALLKESEHVRSAEILHIGCHGFADTLSPELSQLRLTPGGGQDGMLTLRELAALDLRARLVVLSACESNAGRVRMYEGATGFARAALEAGARAVVSTAWRVNDKDGLELMLGFYEALLADGEEPVRALNEAKRRALRRRMPIHSWGAYLLWDAGR